MMNRRTFVKQSCMACIGLGIGVLLLDSCQTVRYSTGIMAGNKLTVPLSEFTITDKNGVQSTRHYIIVKHDSLQYPICVYRFSPTEFKSIWLRCSHQGAELQVSGDTLVCQAHGSEFDNKGHVTNGPADKDLRTFETHADDQFINIALK